MTTTPETETEIPQTSEELLAELAQLHIRTIVPPSPKQPAAFGWQAIAGCQAAGFARALHALMEVAPEKAAEITDWFQGPFEEGPDPEEHTDWIERTVAKDVDTLDTWITEARELAVKSAEATAAGEKAREAGQLEHDAVHKHFGLSYANYLVIPRALLQSMPQEWQSQFVALLKTLEDAFAHVPQADVYDVTAGKENLLRDMTESELYAACVEVAGDDDMGHGPNTVYRRLSDGEELDGDSYGFMPGKDPVPHYNRGRTRVEPRLGGGE
jgi:hypothetical protein